MPQPPPTTAQLHGMAYAPMPFAVSSLLSSGYVVHHIMRRQPQKRGRPYHRLVLAMNAAVSLLSLNYLLGPLAVPAGTPGYALAAGTVATCTAAGFTAIMLSMTVPIYYGSLGLQSSLLIRNDFRGEKVAWVEKWIHLVAWAVPLAVCAVCAAHGNFNPAGSGCSIAASPLGCDVDPDAPCERGGGNIAYFVYIVAFGQYFLYFVAPPLGMIFVYRSIRESVNRMEQRQSRGMQLIRESAQKRMMQSAKLQISLYLFSFWLTFIPTMAYFLHLTLTGEILYNLLIFAICIFAWQGSVLVAVYFLLERISQRKVVDFDVQPQSRGSKLGTTVSAIRHNASTRNVVDGEAGRGGLGSSGSRRSSSGFSIFDGTVDMSSPWAQFIDEEGEEDEDDFVENAAEATAGAEATEGEKRTSGDDPG